MQLVNFLFMPIYHSTFERALFMLSNFVLFFSPPPMNAEQVSEEVERALAKLGPAMLPGRSEFIQ